MKVLLSAYACDPGKGSEPGVGWHWAVEIARLGHEVHVLTRTNNRRAIEATREAVPPGMVFHYYDLGLWSRYWKRGIPGLAVYYWLWQAGAASKAADLNAREHFDLVHHLTFGSVKLPTFMYRLNVPMVLGPLGGGETAPWPLRRGYSWRGKSYDALRDVGRFIAKHTPLLERSHDAARLIALRTPENLDFIAEANRHKVTYISDVGASPPAVGRGQRPPGIPLRVLYAGRLLHLKGLHLALGALRELERSGCRAQLTIVGRGSEKATLVRTARKLGVEQYVEWVDWLPQEKLGEVFRAHDVFLFPSLHNSGGSVVPEAIAHGLPVVCLDLGGPAMLVTPQSGIKVQARGRTEQQVATGLAEALARLSDPEVYGAILSGIGGEAERLSWSSVVRRTYNGLA